MKVEVSRRQLRYLGESSGQGQPRHGVAAQVFKQPASEISHFYKRSVGESVQFLYPAFRSTAGGCGDMGKPARPRHIHAAVDGFDPCRTGIGDDDARGAENRQPADDAKTLVEGFSR